MNNFYCHAKFKMFDINVLFFMKALREIVKTTWENHHGQASLVSWDHFTDLEHVQGLICCFGSDILSGICERLAKDFRFTRSGVPDLVVWNPETLHVKIVEVKGPGDKLSSKQILWLDYLIQLGADAEVCLVEAVGSKKLRKETF
ncbi:UNVERIFIED_CONTAM: Fan1 [Trichonephila clavipes]